MIIVIHKLPPLALYFLIFTFKYKVINLFIVLTVQPLLPNFYSCWVSYVPNRTVPNGTFSKEVLKSEISIYFLNIFQPRIFSLLISIYILCFLIGFYLFCRYKTINSFYSCIYFLNSFYRKKFLSTSLKRN